jgi:hypothetical protein
MLSFAMQTIIMKIMNLPEIGSLDHVQLTGPRAPYCRFEKFLKPDCPLPHPFVSGLYTGKNMISRRFIILLIN